MFFTNKGVLMKGTIIGFLDEGILCVQTTSSLFLYLVQAQGGNVWNIPERCIISTADGKYSLAVSDLFFTAAASEWKDLIKVEVSNIHNPPLSSNLTTSIQIEVKSHMDNFHRIERKGNGNRICLDQVTPGSVCKIHISGDFEHLILQTHQKQRFIVSNEPSQNTLWGCLMAATYIFFYKIGE
jgi:hypothetical protein